MDSKASLYSISLQEIIQHCLSHFSELFSIHELNLVKKLTRLEADEINIISRIILRKHRWIRSESLHNYVLQYENFNVVFKSLIDSRHIVPLSNYLDIEVIFEAIYVCLSLDELKSMHKLLKLSTDSKTMSSKASIQNSIKLAICSQQVLFGTLESNILSLVDKVLGKNTVIISLDPQLLQIIRRMQRLVQVYEFESLKS